MSSGTNIYNDNPSPIAVGRIKFDISQIRNDKDVIANEGIYYCFDTENDKCLINKLMIVDSFAIDL